MTVPRFDDTMFAEIEPGTHGPAISTSRAP